MATPHYTPPKQEMPPPGGFAKVKFTRGVPASRGPPGWSLFLGLFVMTSWGYYRVGQHNIYTRQLRKEERERRIAILPFLQAEADVDALQQHGTMLEQEEEIMQDVPGWKVGENVYHSKRYTPPLFTIKSD